MVQELGDVGLGLFLTPRYGGYLTEILFHLWEFELGASPLCSTIVPALDQGWGGNGNKAALSGSLRADPNTAALQKVMVENASSPTAAWGCSTQF